MCGRKTIVFTASINLLHSNEIFDFFVDKIENFKDPTDMCVRILPYECPDIAVPPPSSFDGLPRESYWERLPDKIKDSKAYIPVVALFVGLIGVSLQLRRRRNT